MRVAWPPVLLGLAALLGGGWLLAKGWGSAVEGNDPSGLAALGAGVLLALLGVLMAAVPLLVPVLYRLHGPEAFTSRGGACPVVAKCQRCGAFNFRGRPDCKECGMGLVWEVPAPEVRAPPQS